MKRSPTFLYSMLAFGFAFLYIPIFVMMLYSFNDSRLVTVWGGFTTRWYTALLENEQILEAALLSLEIAVTSATLATVLGTLAGLAMNRMGQFRGRTVFSGMIAAPLVMPEVITGISLLLFFVNFNIDRGMETLIIAHITFTMAFATVVSCTAEKKNPNCVPKTKPPGAASRNFSTVMCPGVATSTKQYTTAAPHAR